MLLEIGQDLSDVAGVGGCFREGQPDFAYRQMQTGADFQQFQADRRALGDFRLTPSSFTSSATSAALAWAAVTRAVTLAAPGSAPLCANAPTLLSDCASSHALLREEGEAV